MNNLIIINRQTKKEERSLIRDVVDTIEESTGKHPQGWLSPAPNESHRTLDVLAECGIEVSATGSTMSNPTLCESIRGR